MLAKESNVTPSYLSIKLLYKCPFRKHGLMLHVAKKHIISIDAVLFQPALHHGIVLWDSPT